MTQINHTQKRKSDADKEIPHINGLVKKTDYNAKTPEIKKKYPELLVQLLLLH